MTVPATRMGMQGEGIAGRHGGRWGGALVARQRWAWVCRADLGTLGSLGPGRLRVGCAAGAGFVAGRVVPIRVASVVVTVGGALAGVQVLAAIGVAAYLGGVVWAVRPLARVTVAKAPAAYATWSVMAAVLWLTGSLLGLVTVLVTSPTWAVVTDRLGLLIIPLAAGFAAQVLLGALSYLVPVVLGGGPTTVRGSQARIDRANTLRALIINVGLMICVIPVPSLVRGPVSVLVLGAFAAFLPLLTSAVLYARRAKQVVGKRAPDRGPRDQEGS